MIENIILFENKRVEDLYPFNIMHCSWELRTGIFLNFKRIKKLSNILNILFIGRQLQVQSFLKRYEISNDANLLKNTLILDGSVSITNDIFTEIKNSININENIIFESENDIVGYFVKYLDFSVINYQNFDEVISKLLENNSTIINLKKVVKTNYLWDTLAKVPLMIDEDIKISKIHNLFYSPGFQNVFSTDPNNIYIGKNVKIAPSVYLDSSNGPIVVGDNVTIMGLAGIIGPTYIGNNSVIKMGAKIYEKNLIGDWCKVGGEVENTIFQSYSNKQHEGFLGHSYIGEWVNLGADTNNSDLKNTYSNIKMRLPHKTVESGLMMLGLMCGDHTKSAINTQFNTGTVTGISAILFESGFLPTNIPSFSYGGTTKNRKFPIEDAFETAKKMMSRRNKILTNEEIAILKHYYENEK